MLQQVLLHEIYTAVYIVVVSFNLLQQSTKSLKDYTLAL